VFVFVFVTFDSLIDFLLLIVNFVSIMKVRKRFTWCIVSDQQNANLVSKALWRDLLGDIGGMDLPEEYALNGAYY
jgi:hypothetical protein